MISLCNKIKQRFLTLVALISVLLASCFSTTFQHVEEVAPQDDTVILYSASWCYWCVKMKEFLVENDIDFVEMDYENEKDREKLIKFAESISYKGEISAIPLMIIKGQILIGYRPLEVLKMLDRKSGRIKVLSREGDGDGPRHSRITGEDP